LKTFSSQKRALEIIGDFFYNEICDSILITYIWKGFYDLLGNFTINIDKIFPNQYEISLLSICLIGYLLYFFIVTYQNVYINSEAFKQSTNLSLKLCMIETVYFLAFFSVVCIWYSIWSLYDKFAINILSPQTRFLTIFATHFGSVIFLSTFRCANTLYGPATLDMDLEEFGLNLNDDQNDSEYVKRYNNDLIYVQQNNITLFRIAYFSKS
jgi:hypothetical protein